MAKYCPEKKGFVLYLDCIECETKECKRGNYKNNLAKGKEQENVRDRTVFRTV